MQVQWKGNLAFESTSPSGVSFVIDAHPESGGEGKGPTPMEALLGALAACTGIDVISILKKKRQTIDSYRIEVDGDRPPDGEYPRPFTAIRLKHILTGPNLDPSAVARAIELSDEKYCSVMATLQAEPAITTTWSIEEVAKGLS